MEENNGVWGSQNCLVAVRVVLFSLTTTLDKSLGLDMETRCRTLGLGVGQCGVKTVGLGVEL